jgi:predicted negative regulator of RcsB-dependent stress response
VKAFIILLLVTWLVVSLVGVLIEGLLWLLFFGVLAFVATAGWGWFKVRQVNRARS